MNKFDNFIKDNQVKRSNDKRQQNLSMNMDFFLFRNIKQFSMGIVELINNTVFHGLDTLKVRLQAKCLTEDVSQFYKNKVEFKPLICGVTSAAVGSFIAGYFFIYSNEKFLHYFFRKSKGEKKLFDIREALNWKGKLISCFILSDIIKTTIFLPFEARKQRIQMFQTEISMREISKYMMRALSPLLLRDIIFRIVTLGFFLNNLNVEHKPKLKYNLSEIRDYIKLKENKKEGFNVSYFMDYSTFQIYSPFLQIVTNLLVCTVVGTVITHPLDVIATKMLTQTRLKYKGVIQSFKIISKEEGYNKLYRSGLNVRISFNLFSAMSVFLLYENLYKTLKGYYEIEG